MNIQEFLESLKGKDFKSKIEERSLAFLDKDPSGDKLAYLWSEEPAQAAIEYTANRELKTIVVCPSFLKSYWKKEIENQTNQKAAFFSAIYDAEINYLIVSWEELKAYSYLLERENFDCLVLNQSHYLRNKNSKRSQWINKLFSKVEYKLLTTATPIVQDVKDLEQQLMFLRPDIFN